MTDRINMRMLAEEFGQPNTEAGHKWVMENVVGLGLKHISGPAGDFIFTSRVWLDQWTEDVSHRQRRNVPTVMTRNAPIEFDPSEYDGPMKCAAVAQRLDCSERTVTRMAGQRDGKVIRGGRGEWYVRK